MTKLLLIGAVVATSVAGAASATGDTDTDADGIADPVDTVDTSGSSIVSVGKPATQSSLHREPFFARGAVDGNLGGHYPTDAITHTASYDDEPWWEVDLGRLHTVEGINLHNRSDSNMESRLAGAEVLIGARPFGDMSLAEARASAVWSTPIGSPDELIQLDVPTRLGRYVRVQIPSAGSNFLHLGEVSVLGAIGRPNDVDGDLIIDAEDTVATTGGVVSTYQPATQSSVSAARPNATADAAVDDSRDGGRDIDLPMALTDDDEPWWEVDLGRLLEIDGINVFNRTDGNQHLIVGAEVMIAALPFGDVSFADAQTAATWRATIASPDDIAQLDVPGQVGRYVRIQLPPSGGNALALAEVDVIAGPATGDQDGDSIPDGIDTVPNGQIVSTGKPAAQSSLHRSPFFAENAVDGDTGGHYPTDPITHTASNDDEPWLDVDLEQSHVITGINVFNRSDGNMEARLAGAEVLIGTAPFGDVGLDDARAAAVWSFELGAGVELYQIDVPSIEGQYVRIQIPSAGSNWLHVGEVQVSAEVAR
ncbi:MAG: discoidin domain-containing protein [Actinomycetota bacterium]